MASNGRTKSVPQIATWTFEDLDQALKLIKNAIHWAPGDDLSSIRVGAHREELQFIASTMRNHSDYFFALSLPTTSYANQFMQDTASLMTLTKEEVEMFEFIIEWCHEGGVLNGRQIYMRHKEYSLGQWICAWRVADILGIPLLQKYVTDTVFWKMTEEMKLPSFSDINYLYSHQPYKQVQNVQFICHSFMSKYAYQMDSVLDLSPHLFVPSFVTEVRIYRRMLGLKRPGKIDAFTTPPLRRGSVKAKESTPGASGQEAQGNLAVRACRPRSWSNPHKRICSVHLSNVLPL